MFGVSFFELVTIFAVALIVFGPERLPEIARSLGKLAGDVRRTSDQMKREFYNQVYAPLPPPPRQVAPRPAESPVIREDQDQSAAASPKEGA